MTKNNLADIIHDLKSTKNLSEELIQIVIEDSLKAAYKRRFRTDENAVVILDIEKSELGLYSRKTIVEEVQDDVLEIDFQHAKNLEPECEVGDEILIEFNPEEFTRTEIMVANQKASQKLREFEGNSLYSEFKNKVGEVVIGYYLRESNNNIVVDLGRAEGILPKRHMSSREVYANGDRIKALILDVKKQGNRFEIILTRTHAAFIQKIFELEVPEVYDGTVEIVKIAREPGYRTKMAVRSSHSDIDPIGTCVGTKGVRINNVMLELDNERIDILKYDSDPLTFIHNALSPAEVRQVIITDYAKRSAIAVVEDDKLSIAIGKLGLNVKLANRLTDWSINVKTISQFQEMDSSGELDLFNTLDTPVISEEVDVEKVNELPDVDPQIIEKLESAGLEYIEDLFELTNEDFYSKGLTETEVISIRATLQSFKDEESEEVEDNSRIGEEISEEDDIKIDVLPLEHSIKEKILAANIDSLYVLVDYYTNGKLSEIQSLSQEDIIHIEQTIKENVELE